MEVLLPWVSDFGRFLPILVRVASFLIAIPMLSGRIPNLVKVAFALLFASLLFPAAAPATVPDDLIAYGLLVVQESLVGVALGLLVSIVFQGVVMAGQFIDVPMGFALGGVFDPEMGVQEPVIARFANVLAMLLFFVIGGHLSLLRALAASFMAIPVGAAQMGPDVTVAILQAVVAAFMLGLQIGIPILAVLFVTDVALGFLARTVPQMNIFVVGFPVKIFVGFLFLLFSLPAFVGLISWAYGPGGQLFTLLQALVNAFSP